MQKFRIVTIIKVCIVYRIVYTHPKHDNKRESPFHAVLQCVSLNGITSDLERRKAVHPPKIVAARTKPCRIGYASHAK
jgi:hypothetical protein